MRIIAHRGVWTANETQNTPEAVQDALTMGFDVEVDVWRVGGRWYFGHDGPEIEVREHMMLTDSRMWLHAKNAAALTNMPEGVHFFWHQEDDHVLTSMGFVWSYPGKELPGGVCVMPERFDGWLERDYSAYAGVCTDRPIELFEACQKR